MISYIGIHLGSGEYRYMPPFSAGTSYYSKAECEDGLRRSLNSLRPEVVKVRSTVITSLKYPKGDPHLYLHIQTDVDIDSHQYWICVAIEAP